MCSKQIHSTDRIGRSTKSVINAMFGKIFLVLFISALSSQVECSLCPRGCNHCSDEHVYCNHANLTSIPPALSTNVKTLDLRGNAIGKVDYLSLRRYRVLEELYLDDNPITSVSDESFLWLGKLKKLTLSTSNVGDFLSGAYNLQHVEIYASGVKNISSLFFRNVPNVQYLGLHDTSIRNIGSEFKYLTNLQTLNLSRNQIETVDKDFVKKGIKVLDLSNNKLTDIVVEEGMDQLNVLNVSGNQLDNLPINKFPNLIQLVANHNKFTEYSFNSTNLQSLDISQNQLRNFTFKKCGNLYELFVSNNPLERFEKMGNEVVCVLERLELRNVSNLKSLNLSTVDARKLDLSQNCLLENITFSESFEKLAGRDIKMSSSCLESIPTKFLQGNHLYRLDLHDNKVDSFPSKPLLIKTGANTLNLSGNYLSVIVFDVEGTVFDVVDLSENSLGSQ